ncbi:hypothetical protein SEVIR_2G240066v4 [Setaria viridis]|uniref:alpha-amylase n=1 Tax=Setaria viridis TaxID=4556 RepID=A0A4U6VWJ4_SETVI|nr:hypothetical protein SEVIR_2G240066v2 [Setaria viridis]
MELPEVRRQRRAVQHPGQRPAGAGELGAGCGRPCPGVRLHHQGRPAGGRPGRVVADEGRQWQGPQDDRLVAGEGGHLRRQSRHRLHPELMAFPLQQGHARLRLHPHTPWNSLHRKSSAASPVHHNKLDPEISTLSTVRSRNGIHAGSKLDILAADGDLYVAKIDDKVIVKIGSGYDIGNLIPRTSTPLPMATTIGRRVV